MKNLYWKIARLELMFFKFNTALEKKKTIFLDREIMHLNIKFWFFFFQLQFSEKL
jgi:hypothetical protein